MVQPDKLLVHITNCINSQLQSTWHCNQLNFMGLPVQNVSVLSTICCILAGAYIRNLELHNLSLQQLWHTSQPEIQVDCNQSRPDQCLLYPCGCCSWWVLSTTLLLRPLWRENLLLSTVLQVCIFVLVLYCFLTLKALQGPRKTYLLEVIIHSLRLKWPKMVIVSVSNGVIIAITS